MKRVLITGATGFVGANLARRLLRDGHQIHVLIRPDADTWRLDAILPELRREDGDIRNGDAVAGVVARVRPEWVFHLAAYGAYSWQSDPRPIYEVNVGGTMNLVAACLGCGVESFCQAGSSSEYGFKDHAPDECEAVGPVGAYAAAKAAATWYCRESARRHHLYFQTLRLYSAYGPYEDPARFIPTLVRCGFAGRFPDLTNPATARDFTHIDDIVEAFTRVIRHQGDDHGAIYNVGTGQQTTLADAVALSRDIFGIDDRPRWGTMDDRIWDTTAWVCNSRRLHAALGWRPTIDFVTGFRMTVEWFRQHTNRVAGGSGLRTRPEEPMASAPDDLTQVS
jgi:dolichol-phosphate mannosyltransferase